MLICGQITWITFFRLLLGPQTSHCCNATLFNSLLDILEVLKAVLKEGEMINPNISLDEQDVI